MDTYGLIGYPLGHSFSRSYFAEKFQAEGIDAEYLNFEIPSAEMLLQVVKEHPTLRGLNCTIPHKEAIIPLLDRLSPEAERIGAVNVIKVSHGKLIGYNSDVIGFTESLRPLLQAHHRKALILGTGGASKAVRAGLEALGIEWRYVSRTPMEGHFTYQYLHDHEEVMEQYTVIVNCSPVGMYPHTDKCPNIPYHKLGERHLLFDLIYNPYVTLFMEKGEERGATTKNGLEMLHLQAEASWRFWNE